MKHPTLVFLHGFENQTTTVLEYAAGICRVNRSSKLRADARSWKRGGEILSSTFAPVVKVRQRRVLMSRLAADVLRFGFVGLVLFRLGENQKSSSFVFYSFVCLFAEASLGCGDSIIVKFVVLFFLECQDIGTN